MADRIKGITIEIDGDTTKLQSALKNVNSDIRSTQNNLKDVNKLLKLDPGNTQLLQQKYKGLGTEIEDTKKKLETLKTAQEQMEASGNVNTDEYDALQREIVETQEKLKGLEDEYKNFGSVQAQQVAAAGEKMKATGEKISGAGEKMLPVTAAITGIGAASVAASTDFESSFAQLSTIADTSEVSTEKLKKQIMDVSNQYGVSASDVAQATYSAISAGRSTGEAVDFVATATQTAKAGFTDTATSIDVLTTIMNAYGDSAGSAESISDKLLTTQNLGKTTFAELGSSIGKVIPTAAMYGVNLDNLAAAYVATTKNGIATAESTTYINGMLNELGKSGSTASDTLKEKTGKTFKELMDSGMSLSDVLGILQQAADDAGLSMADMFGSQEAAKAAATITQHANDFNSALTSMGDSAGTTSKAFEKMEGTTGASMEKMKTAVQNAGIAVGSVLAPFVTKAAQAVADLARAFTNLPASAQKVIIVVAAIIAAVGPVLIFVGKIISAIGSIMTLAPQITAGIGMVKSAVGVLGGGLQALWGILMANPIIFVVAAIAALVAAFIHFWNTSEAFRNFWIGLWQGIKDAVQGFADGVASIWDSIVSAVQTAWDTIKNVVQVGIMAVGEVISAAVQIITLPFQFIWENCKGIVIAAWNAISGAISTALNAIQTIITTVWNAIVAFLTPILNTIRTVVTTVWNAIKTVITTVLNAIKTVITTVFNAIKTVITNVLNAIKTVFTTAWNVIKGVVTSAIGGIKSAISNGLNAAKGVIDNILGAIKSKFTSIWDGCKSIVSGAIEKIKGFMHFSWSLPKLKLPHFSISGNFSLNPPSVPHFSISWYKKAMANGMILDNPTIFGAKNGQLLGGGEAGPEAVVGVDSLRGMIQEAVAAVAGNGGDTIIPVYIGNHKIDEIVVNATQRANYRSGGR